MPIKVTLRPLPAMVLPTWSKLIVISASSAKDVSDNVPGTAPPTLVKADVAICGFVEKMVVPLSLTSTMIADPVGAVLTDNLTLVTVRA